MDARDILLEVVGASEKGWFTHSRLQLGFCPEDFRQNATPGFGARASEQPPHASPQKTTRQCHFPASPIPPGLASGVLGLPAHDQLGQLSDGPTSPDFIYI
jgi:hypothetical protein